ncbi:MAG: diguanylate cyclase [Chloroflexi bacterium]|nr:diguanylate cyclase [Chloroflexota bacterium]
MKSHTPSSSFLYSPLRLFVAVLTIVFVVEAAVMILLFAVPISDRLIEALVDSTLLTLGVAPFLWWFVVRPLRGVALKEQARAATIVAQAMDGIITFDDECQIESINESGENVFGYKAEEVIGKSVNLLFIDLCGDSLATYISRSHSEGRQSLEATGRRKNGSTFPIELTMSELSLERRRTFVIAIVRDISQRKRDEELVRQANEKLTMWIDQLERRNRESALLSDMGDLFQSCHSVDEAYRIIEQSARRLFPDRCGAVYTLNSSRNLVEAVAAWGDSADEMRQQVLAPDECWGFRRGRSYLVADTRDGVLCQHVSQLAKNDQDVPHSYVCIPMMAHGDALGVLHLRGSVEAAIADDAPLATSVAERIALALANLRLRETLRVQSIRDSLTGLFNRRYMEETFERELQRAARKGTPLGVIMLDIDHFKRFNDTFGHEAGDALLRELGQLLHLRFRGADIACRYGGEEFTLILPEASVQATLQRGEELREAVGGIRLEHLGQSLGVVTLSLGVAAFPDHGSNKESLLRIADAALYRAKKEGRNRVVIG